MDNSSKVFLENVFKIGGMPSVTFVEPIEFPQLVVALRTQGRGIVIEGPSGIGKTTAVENALYRLGIENSILKLSARRLQDVDYIAALPTMKDLGIVVIDDFHKLDNAIKNSIADFMKILADQESPTSKIIILGINQAGQSLVDFANDLNNRLEIIPFTSNPSEKIEELLVKGEEALNIQLNIRDEIVAASHGSFYIAQMLAHEACLYSNILEKQAENTTTQISYQLVKGKVFDRLARVFKARTIAFARGTKIRPEGRAPYLHLVYWLGISDQWSLSITEVLHKYPDMKGSIGQIIDKHYLYNIINDDNDIQSVLYFDETTKILSVEDPQYVFYLRNIAWSSFVKEVGYLTMEFPCPYDFALSFAGSTRTIAEKLFHKLTENEFSVFYDFNEQHRILAANVEDYLQPIYMTDAQYVLVLLDSEYPKRIWTRFESQQFRDRFKANSVIPIWFDNVPEGTFDESSRVGGIVFHSQNDIDSQVENIADLCRKKIAETRSK